MKLNSLIRDSIKRDKKTREELISINNIIRNTLYLKRDLNIVFIIYNNSMLSPLRDIDIIRLKLIANNTL